MRRACITAAALAVMLLCAGCDSDSGTIYANYRELENIEIVQTLGLDRVPGGGYTVTVSAGAGGQSDTPLVIAGKGSSIPAAMEQVQRRCAKEELFYAHTRYVLVGEGAAAEGIATLLDFIERSTQIRLDVQLFIVRGGSAEKLMGDSGTGETEISKTLEAVVRDVELSGRSRAFTCSEIAGSLAESGAALACAVSAEDISKAVKTENDGTIAVPVGYGVFRGPQLIGYLTEDAARGANLLLNHPGTGTVELSGATAELIRCKAEMKPQWGEGSAPESLDVHLDARAAIVELGSKTPTLDAQAQSRLSRELAETLERQAQEALEFSIANDADFLAIGRALELDDTGRAASLPSDWLRSLQFTVKCEAQADRTYDIGERANTEGRGIGNAE